MTDNEKRKNENQRQLFFKCLSSRKTEDSEKRFICELSDYIISELLLIKRCVVVC